MTTSKWTPSNFRELLEHLGKFVKIEIADLQRSEFDRGIKFGQMQILDKIKSLVKEQP